MNTEQLNESINRIHQESNESRIKLMTLRACYVNLASAYHNLFQLRTNSHNGKDWKQCEAPDCISNYEVLKKLELE